MQLSLDDALEHTFSVAECSRLIRDTIESAFPHEMWIQGEVRGIRRAQSGHVYFDLIDPVEQPGAQPDAILPVVLFESTKRTVNAQIKRSGGGMRIDDGVAVRLRGTPDFYVPTGKLSLRMTGIDPTYTLGLMAASRDRLLRDLTRAGLIERNALLELPPLPLRVGLVTAAGSAAQADFLHELSESNMAFEVIMVSTPVQGPGAGRRIAAAIAACQMHRVDAIAVVRGGGARTDLVAFDDEAVARAIATSAVPVLTGIGHETDRAVADHVAHRALKTPTACAAHLVAQVLETEQALVGFRARLEAAAHRCVDLQERAVTDAARSTRDRALAALGASERRTLTAALRTRQLVHLTLDHAARRLTSNAATVAPMARHRLRGAAVRTDLAAEAIDRSARRLLAAATMTVERAADRARLLDPARMLARGWSITTGPDGAVLRSITDVVAGDRVATRVVDGSIEAVVADTTTRDADPAHEDRTQHHRHRRAERPADHREGRP